MTPRPATAEQAGRIARLSYDLHDRHRNWTIGQVIAEAERQVLGEIETLTAPQARGGLRAVSLQLRSVAEIIENDPKRARAELASLANQIDELLGDGAPRRAAA